MTVETPLADPVLPMPVRLEFVHALVELVARRAGVRLLHVKGVAAAQHLGLTDRRPTDADVLASPAEVPALVDALTDAGWVADLGRAARVVGHAVILHHPAWACAIDLHHRFPGIELPPARAFELLWSSRATIVLGGREVAVPAYGAHALLLLLHAARGQGSPRAVDDVRQVRAALGTLDAEQLAPWAATLECWPALAAVMPDRWPRMSGLGGWHWRLLAHTTVSGVQLWAARIATARSMRRRAALLLAAAFPDRRTLSQRAGRDLRGTDLLRSATARWGTAVRDTARWVTGRRARPGAATAVVPDMGTGFATLPAPAEAEQVIAQQLAVRTHEERTWVADLISAQVWLLSPSAALVWELARSTDAAPDDDVVGAICEEIRGRLPHPPATLASDVRAALTTLGDLGLLPATGQDPTARRSSRTAASAATRSQSPQRSTSA